MKTKNISKLLMMLLGVIAFSIALVSCGNDDDDDRISEKSILGKWYYEKDIMNGKEDINTEFECSTKKDYIEILSGGKWKTISYDKDCKESIDADDVIWKLSEKVLTLSNSDKTDMEVYTIKSLTESTMVLHYDKNIEDGKEQLIDFDEDGKADDLIIYLKKL